MSGSKKKDHPFASILIRLMNERNVTIRNLARIADVSTSTIDSWRSGSNPQDFVAVKRIARFFGVSVCYLLTGSHEESTEVAPFVEDALREGRVVFSGLCRLEIQELIPIRKDEL